MPGIGKYTTDTTTNTVVIDIDTGTVMGTNLRVATVSDERLEELISSDSEARAYAKKYGRPVVNN